MRKLYFIVLLAMIFQTGWAQTPQAFKYQAVVRNSTGQVWANKLVNLKVSLLLNDPFGSTVYSETHQKATNEFGLININVGEGTVEQGTFNNIDWGAGTYYVKTEVDLNGGNNFEFIGTTQLLSVPYALYAEKSANSINDNDGDPANELQNLSISGHNLSISQGNTITLPDNVDDADADPTNEIQNLSITGHSLTISDGNTITLPDNVDDADADPTNEIQALSISNDTLYLSNGGFVYLGYLLDNTDNQTLSMPDQYTIQISNGNSVTLSAGMADLDADPVNELQVLNLSNDTLYLSQGNFVVLPKSLDDDPMNELQILSRNGSDITLSNGGGTVSINDADTSSTNEIQTLTLANDTLSISNGNSVNLNSLSIRTFDFPFGINYPIIADDTIIVPNDSVFFMLSTGHLKYNNINFNDDFYGGLPIFGPNSIITNFSSYTDLHYGFFCPEGNIITVFETLSATPTNTYTVPANKVFILLCVYSNNSSSIMSDNYFGLVYNPNNKTIVKRIIPSGVSLSVSSLSLYIFGYLIDAN